MMHRLRSATAIRSCIRKPKTYWGNVNPVGPRSVYDEAKRYAEALVMAYHRSHGVNTHWSASSTPTVRAFTPATVA